MEPRPSPRSTPEGWPPHLRSCVVSSCVVSQAPFTQPRADPRNGTLGGVGLGELGKGMEAHVEAETQPGPVGGRTPVFLVGLEGCAAQRGQ
jgi:hypothetical protein